LKHLNQPFPYVDAELVDMSGASPTPCADYVEDSHATAPEVIDHRAMYPTPHPQDGAIDVWALGLTCLELAGQDDIFQKPIETAIEELRTTGPTFTNNVDVDLQAFIMQCLQPDAEARTSSSQLSAVRTVQKN
jgi:serine/threonine protein kinase